MPRREPPDDVPACGTKDYLTDVYAQWASEEYNDAQA
jgi:hypothetical protein